MTTDTHDDEPPHHQSATGSLLAELQLYGHRAFQDEPDMRPLPQESTVRSALADIFDALVCTCVDTRLEPDCRFRADPATHSGMMPPPCSEIIPPPHSEMMPPP